MGQGTTAGLHKAHDHFKAIELDPTYARAYSGLATPTHCSAATTSCRSASLTHWGERRR